MIEKRALQVYPPYFNCLTEAPFKVILQKIIKDESQHLEHLEGLMKELSPHSVLQTLDLPPLEEQFFSDYLEQMQGVF